jgi:hypothetical protein
MRFYLILILTCFILPDAAYACTRAEEDVPIQAWFTRADAVFFGKVTSIQKLSREEKKETGIAERVTFKLLANYKGIDQPSVEMMNSGWETECGLHLKKGQKWVIYANYDASEKRWLITGGGKDDGDDREYFDFLKAAGTGTLDTIISGHILPFGLHTINSYAGTEVVIERGGQRQTTFADADGKYSFMGLAPGDYAVRFNFKYQVGLHWLYEKLGALRWLNNYHSFEYNVRLGKGEHDYRFMEILRYERKSP